MCGCLLLMAERSRWPAKVVHIKRRLQNSHHGRGEAAFGCWLDGQIVHIRCRSPNIWRSTCGVTDVRLPVIAGLVVPEHVGCAVGPHQSYIAARLLRRCVSMLATPLIEESSKKENQNTLSRHASCVFCLPLCSLLQVAEKLTKRAAGSWTTFSC